MESKERLLELLSKFGMDLNYHDPFLYERKGKYGLVYTFSHSFYGILTRAVFFENEQDAYEFLYQYWWYKKYGETYHVSISLSDYESFEVSPSFMYLGQKITSEEMKELLILPSQASYTSKKVRTYQRYLRTAQTLMQILKLKIKFQDDTQNSVYDLRLELQKQQNEYIQLLNRYEKTNRPLDKEEIQIIENEYDLKDFEEQLTTFERNENIEELKVFIQSLWQELFSIECMEQHLKNKYSLIKMPLELEDIRKKKSYLESLFNKKKTLFSKKEHASEELQKIDDLSEIKKIVNVEDYINNELKRLEEKYSIIDEMDYTTLGDYLNEFDNMGVNISIPSDDKSTRCLYHDELISEMVQNVDSFNVLERQSVSIYHSFLENLCDEILIKLIDHFDDMKIVDYILQNHLEEINNDIRVLSDPENVFIRMKKMKILSLTNPESFCKSLIEVCKTVLAMKNYFASSWVYLFGKSKMKNDLPLLYHASCNSSSSPAQVKGEYDVHDILKVQSGVNILFFSYYYSLKNPYFHDDSLEEKTNREDVLLILKNYQVNFSKSDILNVVRYKVLKNGKIVSGVEKLTTDYYRHITVTR